MRWTLTTVAQSASGLLHFLSDESFYMPASSVDTVSLFRASTSSRLASMFPLAVIAVIAGNLDLHFLSHESFPLAGSGCWPRTVYCSNSLFIVSVPMRVFHWQAVAVSLGPFIAAILFLSFQSQ